jgi:hypothetical protein
MSAWATAQPLLHLELYLSMQILKVIFASKVKKYATFSLPVIMKKYIHKLNII